MIGINQKGQVRIWGNENFAVNEIRKGSSVRSESVMINQLAAEISKHVRNEDFREYENLRISLAQHFSLMDAKIHTHSVLSGTDYK